MMHNYDNFAFYYDVLMQDAEYSDRAEYLLELLKRLKHIPGLTLDLACGTGNLLFELIERGIDIYGVDMSPGMLAKARDNAYDRGIEEDILLLCQDMRKLDLYGTVDTVICTLDSLNHLPGEKDVLQTFKRVELFLNPGGWFAFDMNTVYKHQKILGNNAFVFEEPEVFCAWRNSYTEDNHRVSVTLDFFEKMDKSYRRSSEHFTESAYEQSMVESMLHEAGFSEIYVYDDCTFSPPKPDSQRLIYAAQKPFSPA